jgi:membrane protease subunit HflC
MKRRLVTFLLVLVALAAFVAWESAYTLRETEQAIITEFGKPMGNPETHAGLHFKMPFVQHVNIVQKQILEWDGQRSEMPTRDKLYISVDMFARWRITNPLEYFRRLRDERSAQSRLDDILGSETRNSIAKHDLIEVVRTTKDRVPEVDAVYEAGDLGTGDADNTTGNISNIGVLQPIKKGRKEIEEEIMRAAKAKLAEFGIDLLDVRFKRINYNPSVVEKIYDRMISERQQIASRFRSEGEGEAAKILGNKERDLSVIESEAYEKVQRVRGEADAKAIEIYAQAYGQTDDAREFYEFLKTMETFKKTVSKEDTIVFSTEGDLYRFLDDAEGKR